MNSIKMKSEVKQIDYYLVGIGNHPKPILNDEVLTLINESTIFSGGQRHYELVKSLLPADYYWIKISGKMDEVISKYQSIDKKIVRFTSGDPCF